MKNILLIIHKLSNGGAERAITNLANVLKDDYNVTMVVFDNSKKEYIPNVKIIDLGTPANSKANRKISVFFNRLKRVKKIKKEYNIDCSISFLTGPNLINCLSKKNDKVIISIRNLQSKLNLNFFMKLANQISINKSDKVVTVSKMVEKDIRENYKNVDNKIITIYNMIDNKLISNLSQDIEIEKELLKDSFMDDSTKSFNIITIGRLILQKGQWHLIKAFKVVVEKYENAKLIILGRGELKGDFKKLIKELNIENNVFLLDYRINPYKYLMNSDVFVLTSFYEGMPNVVLEAMACGLPIIATDIIGGTKEILSPNSSLENFVDKVKYVEYGILFPNMNEKYDISKNITNEEINLSKTIIDLFLNKEKLNYYENKSKVRIKDFENNIIKKQWIKIIEE